MALPETISRRYLPLVDACAQFGIRRTRAFQLAHDGLLDVFKIGRRTFCYIESLETLPTRLSVTTGKAK